MSFFKMNIHHKKHIHEYGSYIHHESHIHDECVTTFIINNMSISLDEYVTYCTVGGSWFLTESAPNPLYIYIHNERKLSLHYCSLFPVSKEIPFYRFNSYI